MDQSGDGRQEVRVDRRGYLSWFARKRLGRELTIERVVFVPVFHRPSTYSKCATIVRTCVHWWVGATSGEKGKVEGKAAAAAGVTRCENNDAFLITLSFSKIIQGGGGGVNHTRFFDVFEAQKHMPAGRALHCSATLPQQAVHPLYRPSPNVQKNIKGKTNFQVKNERDATDCGKTRRAFSLRRVSPPQ